MKNRTKSPRDLAERARIKNKPKKPRPEHELRRSPSLKRELDILQSVMDGAVNSHLVYLDRNFNFIRVNETYARTCGYKPEDMIGKNHFALYPHSENEAIFARVRDTGEPVEIHDKPFVFPDQPERGITYWDWTLTPIKRDGQVEGLVFSLHETTDRKRAEEALRKAKDDLEDKVQERTYQLSEAIKVISQSEEKYRELVERAQSIILRMDCDGNVTFFNEFAEKFFGYSQHEILGRNVIGTIVPEKESSGRDLKLLIKDLALRPDKYVNNENENMRKNGERLWISWTNAPAYDAHGKVKEILCVGNDITQRRKLEQRLRSAQKNLRAMAAEIVIADERSRQHFAADLHDTVIQTIGAAKLRSQFIQDDIPEKVSKDFGELQNLISESITQARFIMAEMSPPVLNELGFMPALEWLAEQIEKQHGIKIEFKAADGFTPLQHDIQVLLFQATRELLMNVVKHAKADKALVKVSGDEKKVRIEVTDDGKGFDKHKAFRTDVSSGGFGLFSIRERIRHFGGHLLIKSEEGEGARVILTAPRISGGDIA